MHDPSRQRSYTSVVVGSIVGAIVAVTLTEGAASHAVLAATTTYCDASAAAASDGLACHHSLGVFDVLLGWTCDLGALTSHLAALSKCTVHTLELFSACLVVAPVAAWLGAQIGALLVLLLRKIV